MQKSQAAAQKYIYFLDASFNCLMKADLLLSICPQGRVLTSAFGWLGSLTGARFKVAFRRAGYEKAGTHVPSLTLRYGTRKAQQA